MSNRQTARKGEDYFIRLKDVFLFPVNVELASELSPTFRKKSDLRDQSFYNLLPLVKSVVTAKYILKQFIV